MSNPSFNPVDYPSGAFSPLLSLVRDALIDMGESTPDVMVALNSKRLTNCANRVINDVNRHPVFLDILKDQWTPITGTSITAGTQVLTLPSTAETILAEFTPVKVVGAGDGGGDLYSFVLKNNIANQVTLVDVAQSTVTSAETGPIHTSRLRLYSTTSEVRPVDDQTMIEGIKFYYTIDDRDLGSYQVAKSTQYFDRLNTWMVSLQNYLGELVMEPRDEWDV